MTAVAFIFARGGSKGLPGKNIMPLCGKPLLHYAIDLALSMPEFAAVYVSTDHADIAKSALDAGAKVIQRPAHLATDTAPEWQAWQHAIEYVRDVEQLDFDTFVSLPTTSPLRQAIDVQAALAQLANTQADICISVTPAARNPHFNMVKKLEDGVRLFIDNAPTIQRRQDAPVAFDITTVVYASRVSYVLTNDKLFAGRVTSIEVPKQRAVDIDDIYDFWLAESILNHEQKLHVK